MIFNVKAPIRLFRSLQKILTSYREKLESTTFEESESTTSLHTMSSHISCNKPFRAEHVGSFLRPDDLLHVRHAWNDKKATGIELKTAEDNAVNQIVKLQQDLGFHGINDGEYRRHMFWGTFWSNLDGMKEVVGPDPGIFRPYIPDVAAFLEVCPYACPLQFSFNPWIYPYFEGNLD